MKIKFYLALSFVFLNNIPLSLQASMLPVDESNVLRYIQSKASQVKDMGLRDYQTLFQLLTNAFQKNREKFLAKFWFQDAVTLMDNLFFKDLTNDDFLEFITMLMDPPRGNMLYLDSLGRFKPYVDELTKDPRMNYVLEKKLSVALEFFINYRDEIGVEKVVDCEEFGNITMDEFMSLIDACVIFSWKDIASKLVSKPQMSKFVNEAKGKIVYAKSLARLYDFLGRKDLFLKNISVGQVAQSGIITECAISIGVYQEEISGSFSQQSESKKFRFLSQALQVGNLYLIEKFLPSIDNYIHQTPGCIDMYLRSSIESKKINVVKMLLASFVTHGINYERIHKVITSVLKDNRTKIDKEIVNLLDAYLALKSDFFTVFKNKDLQENILVAYKNFLKGNSEHLRAIIFPINNTMAVAPIPGKMSLGIRLVVEDLKRYFASDKIKPLILTLAETIQEIDDAIDLLEIMQLISPDSASKERSDLIKIREQEGKQKSVLGVIANGEQVGNTLEFKGKHYTRKKQLTDQGEGFSALGHHSAWKTKNVPLGDKSGKVSASDEGVINTFVGMNDFKYLKSFLEEQGNKPELFELAINKAKENNNQKLVQQLEDLKLGRKRYTRKKQLADQGEGFSALGHHHSAWKTKNVP